MSINAIPHSFPAADLGAGSELLSEVAQLIVSSLNLEIAPESIDSLAPLYGGGLGLDSVDILDIALVVSKRFGFQLRSDTADNTAIFTSLDSLTKYIAAHRSK
jgi:acyl carrier protein